MSANRLVGKAAHWLLMAVVVLSLVTGFGITEFRTIERLTSGLLTKQMSFKIHSGLWIPLVVLLALHIYLVLSPRKGKTS